MGVIHIISGGEVGGSKNHLISLAAAMKARNEKSIIVCFIEGQLYREAREMGLDIRLVKQSKRFDLSIVSQIKDICEAEGVDIVNCHGGRANFIGYFLKGKYRAKYVTTVHSDYRDDYRGNFYKTLIYSNINKFVLKSFDFYITVSDEFRKMLVDRGFDSKKIYVVYNGIDFGRKLPELGREEIIEKYGLRKSGHFVSMVARFHPVKGHKIFLDACRKVTERFKDVTFVLVGDGGIMKEMMEYAEEIGISDSTCFTGFKKPDELLYISDFSVLASYTESFPLVILESAACRRTVISTEVGGVPQLIEDGVNGYLVPVGNSHVMAERMTALLENSEACRDMGERLYLKASENYSIDNLVESYLEIYKSMLV